MNKKVSLIIILIIIIFFIGAIVYKYYVFYNPKIINIPITQIRGDINTGQGFTGINNTTGSISNTYTVDILNNPLEINSDTLSEKNFPLIKINKPVKNLKINFDVTFTDHFKKYYKGYIDANGYFFAFKFFIGSQENGGFINVFRNQNDGVANSVNGDLTGAKLGNEITNGTIWVIEGEKTKIAQPAGTYGFTYAYPTQYINSQVGKQLHIGGHLSSVKEMKGRNFTKINQITIEYEGEEGSIELVQ